MKRPANGLGVRNSRGACALGAAICLTAATAVPGQETTRPGAGPTVSGPYPRLPRAVTTAPDWIGADAPFDLARYFTPAARDRNAAPVYLDALFEFGPAMAVCFPDGRDRDRRGEAAAERMKEFNELLNALRIDPTAVPAESIDRVTGPYEAGFRKLVEAQQRPRCVFEAGPESDVILCHAEASRQVLRIAMLRVRRMLERGEYNAAIGDVNVVLRLVRDLRPRGSMLTQLVAAAITRAVCIEMINPILASPGLQVEYCDRLLRILLDHEASSSDGYAEGLRTAYVVARSALRPSADDPSSGGRKASPDDLAGEIHFLNDLFLRSAGARRDALCSASREARRREDGISEARPRRRRPGPSDPGVPGRPRSRFLHPSDRHHGRERPRDGVLDHHAALATEAPRLARALTMAAKEAGLRSIPLDPYDGRPMRLALLESPPLIYSVGKDGRDDGGRKDSRFDTLPGDLL